METDFINNLNYRKNFNKFQLPEVIDKAPKILKRNIDTSPFIRVYSNKFLSLKRYFLKNYFYVHILNEYINFFKSYFKK